MRPQGRIERALAEVDHAVGTKILARNELW